MTGLAKGPSYVYVSIMLESMNLELRACSDAPVLPVEAAALFSALSDPLRVSIVRFLDGREAQCVCDIQETFDVAGNLLSYHLKILREAGILASSRHGRWIHYSVAPAARTLIAAALPLAVPPMPTINTPKESR